MAEPSVSSSVLPWSLVPFATMREYEVAFRSHDDAGVLYVNTFAVKVEATGPDLTEASMTKVVDEINTWLTTKYRDCLHGALTFAEIAIRRILPDDGSLAVHAVNATGTLFAPGGQQLPRELCLLLSVKTDDNSRSGRGRMFLPSPRVVAFLGDVFQWSTTTDYWSNAGVFATALLAGHDFTEDLTDYHISTRLWSRKDNATKDVTSIVRKAPYHWLRSRSTAP